MGETESRRQLIQGAWTAAWDRGELDALDRLLSPAYRRIGADQDQDLEEFKASIAATREAFPDLTTVIEDILIDGDRAAIRWRSVGRHEHPFLGVPATKRPVEVTGATFSRFEGDRVVEEFVTWDPRALLSALGIIAVGQDH